jgi:hypothetical protein
MIVNELSVLPDADTIDYLSTIMSGAPLSIDLESIYVVVAQSQSEIKADPNTVFLAKAGSLDMWYDTATGETSLILPLMSPALDARAAEVRNKTEPAFYGGVYIPFLTIVPHMPALSRHYRRFVRGLSDTLWANRQPLVFEREFVTVKDYAAVPNADFYASYAAGARALTL